jgi:hypothetical protein
MEAKTTIMEYYNHLDNNPTLPIYGTATIFLCGIASRVLTLVNGVSANTIFKDIQPAVQDILLGAGIISAIFTVIVLSKQLRQHDRQKKMDEQQMQLLDRQNKIANLQLEQLLKDKKNG